MAVRLDTSTSDIYAIAERHSTSSSTGFDDLVLRASPDNGRTWGAIKTISHTTSGVPLAAHLPGIGSEHLGVAFEEYTGSTFYANLMAIGISNFDDINIWRLDSDTSRAEIRPVVASDIADYPADYPISMPPTLA